MTMRSKLCCVVAILVLSSIGLWGQAQPSQVLPVPIPGGDLIAPFGLFNQFFPGVGTGFDGLNADPHGITNTNGVVAMGYTAGTAKDNNGKTWNVVTDIRVYQADYVGAEAQYGAGGTKSARARGTFVEI
jgi:hypothetical protein